LERGTRLIDSYLADDATFESCQARLLRAFERNDVDASPLRVLQADGQVESGFEVVAGVELLYRYGVGFRRGIRLALPHRLYDAKGGFQPEVYLLPVDLRLDVVRTRARIVEQIAVELRQICRKSFRPAE